MNVIDTGVAPVEFSSVHFSAQQMHTIDLVKLPQCNQISEVPFLASLRRFCATFSPQQDSMATSPETLGDINDICQAWSLCGVRTNRYTFLT